MSTKYKHSHEVPTAVLAKRLNEISDAVGKQGEERDRELTRRIPAELDRDADLVLSEAAQRVLKVEAERDALAAHVERARPMVEAYRGRLGGALWSMDDEEAGYAKDAEGWLSTNPDASLARLKAEWQAEELRPLHSEEDKAVEELLDEKAVSSDEGVTPNYYAKWYKGVKLDPYRIAQLYEIGGGPQEQVLKKALRGCHKGHEELQVIKEIRQALDRWEEMLEEDSLAANQRDTEEK